MKVEDVTGIILVVASVFLLFVVAGGLTEARISPEQEALIAKHELMPGFTRTTAIDMIGLDTILYFVYESDLTAQMVSTSWGKPSDIDRSVGFGLEYIYYQPPDGELHVSFTRKDNHPYCAYCVSAVLYPAYFKRRFPTWIDEICALVAAEELALGMTAEMARASWGRPSDINRSVGSWGVHEQWVYNALTRYHSARYIYFENGVLASWQD